MKRSVRIISVPLLVYSICFATDPAIPASHRSIFQRLAHSAMTMAVKEQAPRSFAAVSFLMDTTALHSVVRNDVINALIAQQIHVRTNLSSADTLAHASVQDPVLSYGQVFTKSLFGSRKVERTISLTLQCTFTCQSTNSVFYAKKFTVSNTDTVAYSQVQDLADESFQVKTLSQPLPSLFDSLLEPVIVSVASAVAIYLFFTIRS